uniref:Uncharacterized protein n=1 Tax=Arundo donax TaxID=35708 RepID=A0A0A9A657_ARUDO
MFLWTTIFCLNYFLGLTATAQAQFVVIYFGSSSAYFTHV